MQESELLDIMQRSTTYSSVSSVEKNKVINYLRSLPEIEAYAWLEKLKNMGSTITMPAAISIMRNNKLVEKFFREGLLESDASTIQFWLGFAIPKLGTRAVVRILSEYGENDKVLVDKALYWLPQLVKDNERELLAVLRKISEASQD
jgi:hypothetical protein